MARRSRLTQPKLTQPKLTQPKLTQPMLTQPMLTRRRVLLGCGRRPGRRRITRAPVVIPTHP